MASSDAINLVKSLIDSSSTKVTINREHEIFVEFVYTYAPGEPVTIKLHDLIKAVESEIAKSGE